jgi:hypothetical protein
VGCRQWPLSALRVPVLVVHNRGDACRFSPFAGASAGLAEMAAALAKQLIAFESTVARGDGCGPLSPHGYEGIEGDVVPAIIGWMRNH